MRIQSLAGEEAALERRRDWKFLRQGSHVRIESFLCIVYLLEMYVGCNG